MRIHFWEDLENAIKTWERAKRALLEHTLPSKITLKNLASPPSGSFPLLVDEWTQRWWATVLPYEGVRSAALKALETGVDPGLLEHIEDYERGAQRYLDQRGTERFKYQGLLILNPQYIPEKPARRLLDGVDYTINLFKKRGVSPAILHESLTYITLEDTDDNQVMQKGKMRSYGGLYHISTRSVILHASLLTNPRKFFERVFLHEVGHLIHIRHIHPEAKALWDAPWTLIDQKDDQIEQAKRDSISVKPQERQRFWDLLVGTKGDLAKVKLKNLDRLKFHIWLRKPPMGNPFVTTKNLRWTPVGAKLQSQLQVGLTKQQEAFYREHLVLDDWSEAYPVLNPEEVAAFIEGAPEVSQARKDRDTEVRNLQIPSEYGTLDRFEDFAETFVVFMLEPETLSEIARFRMQKALSLSGFYDKKVMRLALQKEASMIKQLAIQFLRRRAAKETAAQAYVEQNAKVQDAIEELKSYIKKNTEDFKKGGSKNWGYVEDLKYTHEQIMIALHKLD